MDFYKLFTAACTSSAIRQRIAPEQILGGMTVAQFPDTKLLTLCAGGAVSISSPSHFQFQPLPCHMILYTRSGSGTVTTDGQIHVLTGNTLFFCSCESSFQIEIHSSGWTFDVFYLTGTGLSTYAKYAAQADPVYPVTAASDIPAYVHSLLQCDPVDTPAKMLSVSKWLTAILTELCVSSLNQNLPEEYIPAYLQQLKKQLDEDYRQPFSLSELEEQYQVNKYRLCREFSKYYSQPPLQYINQRRIFAAKDLLLTTDLPIHEVGSQVGIDNTNHFINLFKRQTGATPHAFRQNASSSLRALHMPQKPSIE